MHFKYVYQLEPVENKFVTKCDYTYSLQLLLENSFYSRISLECALKNPDKLREHILKYFNQDSDLKASEWISDKFIVKSILK